MQSTTIKFLINRTILIISSLILFSSCKKDSAKDIFYVNVIGNPNNYYYGNDNNYYIDLDRDNNNDMQILKEELIDTYFDEDLWQYITTYTNSIEFIGTASNLRFAATDDCINLYSGGQKVNEDLNWETRATLSNNYAIPCNGTTPVDGENFVAFRLEIDNEFHYGLMEIDYDVNNAMTLTYDGWAFHNKADKSINTGQTE